MKIMAIMASKPVKHIAAPINIETHASVEVSLARQLHPAMRRKWAAPLQAGRNVGRSEMWARE